MTLRDSVFDASEVYDHCAQLIDTLNAADPNPIVLVLQTDGGPDHLLKQVSTKVALLALAKKLDVDRLVVLRYAPNGSAMNKVERSMSILNLPLAHVAIMRGDMAPLAEQAVTSANSMASVRTIADGVDKTRRKAVVNIEDAWVIYTLDWFVKRNVTAALPGLKASQVTKAVSRVSAIVLQCLGIERIPRYQDIRGAIETPDSIAIAQDASLSVSVAEAKLATAVVEAGNDFQVQWAKPMQEPIDAISEKFSHLMTGEQPVVIRPRVPKESVPDLYEELEKIDDNFTPLICLTKDLPQVTNLCVYMNDHVVLTPSSFDYQKCNNVACCGAKRIPVQFQELVMQRQPPPAWIQTVKDTSFHGRILWTWYAVILCTLTWRTCLLPMLLMKRRTRRESMRSGTRW